MFKISLISFSVVLSVCSGLYSQPQKSWQWVRQIGSDSWDISAGIVCDAENNLYIAGSFFDTLSCQSGNIVSSGNTDIFISKFDVNGQLKELWQGGGRGRDIVTSICAANGGNILAGGLITDTVTFGKVKSNSTDRRLFVVMLDSKGRFAWINTISFSGEATLFLLASDKEGNIYASGSFSGKLETGDLSVISKGRSDVFLARFSVAGSAERILSFGSTGDDSPGALSVDESGSVLLAGNFAAPFDIGSLKLTPGQNAGGKNVFVAKFDKDVNPIWGKSISGNDYIHVSSLETSDGNNFFMTGTFSSRFEADGTVLVSKGFTDAFVIKYNPDGRLQWARSFGSEYYDYARNVVADLSGGAIIAGTIGGIVEVDSVSVDPVSAENSAIVLQFSSAGKVLWGDGFSGGSRNFSQASALDKSGNLYLTGSFRDILKKGGDELSSSGDQDLFVAKYYNCPVSKAEISGDAAFCAGGGTDLSVRNIYSNVTWNDTLKGVARIRVNKPGPYWVTITDRKGCLLTDTLIVRESPLPAFSLGNDTTMLSNDSLLLRAPLIYRTLQWSDNSTGEWYFAKPGEDLPGTYSYWLTVTDSLSCSYTDTISIRFLSASETTGAGKLDIVVYPNPVKDKLNWYIDAAAALELGIELIDANGKVVYAETIKQYMPGEVRQIDMTGIPPGSYLLRAGDLSSEMNFTVLRVIKQ